MPNTREKLIEIIGKTDIQMIKPDGPHIPMNERFSALFIGEIADHLIANGVTVQKWIPVTERLPEQDGDYLVYCGEYDGICVVYYEVLKTKSKWHCKWKEVTHWMPLPMPPEGE